MKIFAAIVGTLLLLIGGLIVIIGLAGANSNGVVGSDGFHGWECTAKERDQETCQWTGPNPGKLLSPVVQVLGGGMITLAGAVLLAAPAVGGGAQPSAAPAGYRPPPPPMGPPVH